MILIVLFIMLKARILYYDGKWHYPTSDESNIGNELHVN